MGGPRHRPGQRRLFDWMPLQWIAGSVGSQQSLSWRPLLRSCSVSSPLPGAAPTTCTKLNCLFSVFTIQRPIYSLSCDWPVVHGKPPWLLAETWISAKALLHEGALAFVNCIYHSNVTSRPGTAILQSIKGTACGIWLGCQLQCPLSWLLDAEKGIFALKLMCCG